MTEVIVVILVFFAITCLFIFAEPTELWWERKRRERSEKQYLVWKKAYIKYVKELNEQAKEILSLLPDEIKPTTDFSNFSTNTMRVHTECKCGSREWKEKESVTDDNTFNKHDYIK